MSDALAEQAPGYPVVFDAEPQLTERNRLTTAFRLVLGIPHILIIGGVGVGLGAGGIRGSGALSAAAVVMAIVSSGLHHSRADRPRSSTCFWFPSRRQGF